MQGANNGPKSATDRPAEGASSTSRHLSLRFCPSSFALPFSGRSYACRNVGTKPTFSQKDERTEAIPLVRCDAFLLRFCSKKNATRSRSLEAQGSCCSFWPKLSNDPNLSKIRPCLAEIGSTLFQPNQQERTAPNQSNRLRQRQLHPRLMSSKSTRDDSFS